MVESLKKLAEKFNIEGEVKDVVLFGNGHINETYKVFTDKNMYTLQKINKVVFPDPAAIMENSVGVTGFLAEKIKARGGDIYRETLHFLKADEGKYYVIDENGDYWRSWIFIDKATAHEVVTGPEMLEESGRAFGEFQRQLADYPADTLHEVIKDFHNTPARFKQLTDAIEANKSGRKGNCKAEIEFALSREEAAGELMKLLNEGKLPLKVTHNDTKMSNILVDDETNKAVCIIDLDTVMPGLTAFDYGDSLRAGASTAAEDEADLSKVWFDLGLFEAYTKGFLSVCKDALTELELETLPLGAKLMTYEVGIRFLADYINGDVYFRTKYPEHNLVRARNQFKLVKDIEDKWDKIMEIIHKYM